MSDYHVRRAHRTEHLILSNIAVASKAHWGYSAELLASWHAELIVSPEMIDSAMSYVATYHGDIVGFFCRPVVEDLCDDRLFIAPAHIGKGCGRLLFSTLVREAKRAGLRYLLWETDDYAVGFYLKVGAEKIAEKVSTQDPRIKLPIMRYQLG